ncbi:hypothetical protein [uncultured Lacinutrix sp.]|uniref:hypothetical protein n=1 Tax=uncultured Lacinutrix sp. TaxID=574032 RepID=UPI0026130853|nr:hypothetical protein [uncultured Lacinutrix sp.]
MKKFKFILSCLIAFSFMACTQDDANVNNIYDNSGQTGVGFRTTFTSAIVPIDGEVTKTVTVQATTTSSSARSYNVSVDPESTGNPADYTIGTLTIPAGEYDGTLDVTFGNFANLPELVNQTLILNLDLPSNVAVVGSASTEFSYLKFVVCNDMMLVLNEDQYADERTWDITDSTGAVVQSGGPYAQIPGGQQITENFTLADGCYTFTIYDSFGDGQFDGNITGDYTLSCSVITHATGGGNFGGSQATPFCVNQ